MALSPKPSSDLAAETSLKGKRIVICGEVSSGKSTVMQVLLRDLCLPDFFGIQDRPVIRIKTGAVADDIAVFNADGSIETPATLADIEAKEGLSEIRVSLKDAGTLGACELIEMPPLRDGHLTASQREEISGADILVWATIGSQAWRLSEKTILDELDKDRPSQAILAVTRGDKFRSDDDRERLMDRMHRETSEYFRDRLMLCAPPAEISASQSDATWQTIGGSSLYDALVEAAAEVGGDIAETTESAEVVAFEPKADTEKDEEATAEKRTPRTHSRLLRDDEVDFETLKVIETADVEYDETETDETPTNEDAPETIDEAPEQETQEDPSDPLDVFLGTLHGVIAVGIAEVDKPEDPTVLLGDEDAARDFASFCVNSATALLSVAGFGGMDPNPESEQVSMTHRQVLYRVADGKVIFLACESAKMSSGIARTSFARLVRLADTKATEASAA